MKNLTLSLLALVAVTLLYSCASYGIEDLPLQPGDQEAVIYMIRPNEKRGEQIFSVYLDQIANPNFVGSTNGGEYIYFAVKPGIHTIWSVANNKARLQIHPRAGDVMFITMVPSWGMVKLRMTKQSDGLSSMRHLKLGSME